jgi:hypothetical protein
VGFNSGLSVGDVVGFNSGLNVGDIVGFNSGLNVGSLTSEGDRVGEAVGSCTLSEGDRVGEVVGSSTNRVGERVGDIEGGGGGRGTNDNSVVHVKSSNTFAVFKYLVRYRRRNIPLLNGAASISSTVKSESGSINLYDIVITRSRPRYPSFAGQSSSSKFSLFGAGVFSTSSSVILGDGD